MVAASLTYLANAVACMAWQWQLGGVLCTAFSALVMSGGLHMFHLFYGLTHTAQLRQECWRHDTDIGSSHYMLLCRGWQCGQLGQVSSGGVAPRAGEAHAELWQRMEHVLCTELAGASMHAAKPV
jgi:hypothetical protein